MSNPEIQTTDRPAPPPTRSAKIKWTIIVVVAAIVIVGGIIGSKIYFGIQMGKKMAGFANFPQTVSTAVAAKTSWQAHAESVGSVRALRGADLAAQADGVVDKIEFESGNEVAAGTTLLRLRPNDDPAKLAQLEAAAVLAELTYKRDQEQLAAQAISQATLDSDEATLKSARAQVAAQQALIEEKIVRAPFAGRLGIRQVDEGQYLSAGTMVVTLQALDPIVIDFYVPQQILLNLKTGQAVTATIDTYPGATFTGTVTSINSKVDTASRNVQVRATFHNADRRLVPGMYATVAIDAGAPQELVTVPQTAITYNPYGATVFVVDQSGRNESGAPKAIAKQHFVEVGPTRGDQVAVTKGLAADDVVVTGGQLKLRNGSPVAIDNTVKPADDAAPTPPNE
ncbi:MAG: efflux RND transporter periplasmic adaptor subunit [Steroidobacteraceae bacterium]